MRERASWCWVLFLLVCGCRCVDASDLRFTACDEGQCQEGSLCCDGRCFTGTTCPPPQPCEGGFLCGGACVDLAVSDQHCGACQVTCGGTTACANGRCLPKRCAVGECGPNGVCVDETCIERPCLGRVCRDTEVCFDGACRSRLCAGVLCGAGTACLDGGCADVACRGVTCPGALGCQKGRCDLEGGCTSKLRDGTESDVDCGGAICASCQEARACVVQSDCAGFSCDLDGGFTDDAGVPALACGRAELSPLDLTFAALLFRLPDDTARITYAAQAAQGRVGLKAIAATLVSSREFRALRAARPPRQLLSQLYAVLLGRALDDTGEALYLPLLFADRHADVFNALVASREFSSRYPTVP